MDFPIAIHISQRVLDEMLREIINSLYHYRIRKIVLINGHGGNDFKPLIHRIQSDINVYVFQIDWWKVGEDRYFDIFNHPDDHAGEMETSGALALYPHLVALDYAKDGAARPFKLKGLREGWVKTSRDFGKLNKHCATANPLAASAEKGRRYLDIVIERIAEFLIELAEVPIDEFFPYSS